MYCTALSLEVWTKLPFVKVVLSNTVFWAKQPPFFYALRGLSYHSLLDLHLTVPEKKSTPPLLFLLNHSKVRAFSLGFLIQLARSHSASYTWRHYLATETQAFTEWTEQGSPRSTLSSLRRLSARAVEDMWELTIPAPRVKVHVQRWRHANGWACTCVWRPEDEFSFSSGCPLCFVS